MGADELHAGLPGDLEEAAYVDGATPFQVFYKVLLPLIAPGLVTTGLLAFIAAWNEYLFALSFIQDPDKYTVPLALTSFIGQRAARSTCRGAQIMAATIVVTIPLICGAGPAEADPGRPHRRRRQGLKARRLSSAASRCS